MYFFRDVATLKLGKLQAVRKNTKHKINFQSIKQLFSTSKTLQNAIKRMTIGVKSSENQSF